MVVVAYGCLLVASTDTPKGRFMNDDASPEQERMIKTGNIKVLDDAFIGSCSIIMPNVCVGKAAVIAARTPSNMLVYVIN